jgi:hypothetical protein
MQIQRLIATYPLEGYTSDLLCQRELYRTENDPTGVFLAQCSALGTSKDMW